jgi:hypothetical protein
VDIILKCPLKMIIMAQFTLTDRPVSTAYRQVHKQKRLQAINPYARFGDPESYKLLVSNAKVNSFRTEEEICFCPGFSFGTDYRRVIKRFGAPEDVHYRALPDDRRILYYPFEAGGCKGICEMHFFRGRLFYFQLALPHISFDKKNEVLRNLSERYLNGNIDLHTYNVVDRDNNMLFINDVKGLTVNYVAAGSEFYSSMHRTDASELKERCSGCVS